MLDQSVDENEPFSEMINSLVISYCLLLQQFKPLDDQTVQRRLAGLKKDDSAEEILRNFAALDDVKVKIVSASLKGIPAKKLPALAQDKSGRWFLLFKKTGDQYLIKRIEKELPEQLNHADMELLWQGSLAVITATKKIKGHFEHFDIRWFVPEIYRFKGFIGELVVSAFCIQLIALTMPLVFQVIMDKVIINQARDTLNVLVILLVVMTITEFLLQCSRQYVATHTANRIDARLGNKLYEHLVELPLSYFQSRSIGVTVMRVTQLNRIREFITGAANTLILDVFFLLVFLAVMLLYSPLLTLIIALTIPTCLAVAFIITPKLQQHLMTLYHHAAVNSAFLTETLNGVETVKSQAIEPQMIEKFEVQTRDMTLANFKVSRLMQQQDMWVQLIQKMALACVIWLGAKKVIQFELSIGQLIAFNMMAQHALQPITKLTQLWRDFVQTKVSLLQLGDILNTPSEVQQSATKADFSGGDIVFDQISFRYDLNVSLILEGVSLTIPQGQSVAIIGESGSGKSTVVKLLQKLYLAESGEITIGDEPLSDIPTDVLRRQIGVVSQENFLFNKTVRENIALRDPSATLSQVIDAAKLAGAHAFIVALDEGYDTLIDEGGMSLSGGQKQRIAIARALMQEPSILIFDEATSALDEISQKQVQDNLIELSKNRTVITIAHRLSTIKHCDTIFVFKDKGVYESGSHECLISDKNTEYAKLWRYQTQAKDSQ